MSRRLKRPRDPVQLGKLIVDIATGEIEDRQPDDGNRDVAAVERGRKGGISGGAARAAPFGAPEVLKFKEVSDPRPVAGEVRIGVKAIADRLVTSAKSWLSNPQYRSEAAHAALALIAGLTCSALVIRRLQHLLGTDPISLRIRTGNFLRPCREFGRSEKF